MDPSGQVPIERLLEHRTWVRALARSLVHDDSRADDVAQDAWLAAMTHPPRHADGLRGWLAQLVRHRASNARRAEQRRERRDSVAPEAGAVRGTMDPADAVAQIEEHGRVVRAVLALPEPYRGAVVLRFFEDLDAAEIAARTGTPVETVRTRLKRALAMLRTSLDDEHGGGAGASRGALMLLVGGTGGTSLAPWIQGGAAVTTKSKVALVVAALVLLGMSAVVAVVATRDDAGTGSAPSDVADAAPHRGTHAERAAKPLAATPAEPAPSTHETASILGRVRFADGYKPAPGVEIALTGADTERRVVVTDERGGFVFDRLADDRLLRVAVDVPTFAPVVVPGIRLDRDEARDLGVLTLEAPARLDVVVRDWSDRPIAGADVGLLRDAAGTSTGLWIGDLWGIGKTFRDVPDPAASARTDATGRASFISLPSAPWVVTATAPGFARGRLSSVASKRGDVSPEVVMRLDRGFALAGRVVDAAWKPVSGATVWAKGVRDNHGPEHVPHAETGADGRFTIDAVEPGDVALLVGRAGVAAAEAAAIRVPASGPVDIVLGSGTVRGRVTSEGDGAPVAGARVLAWVTARVNRSQCVVETTTADDGTYELATAGATGVSSFRVERPGFATMCERGDGRDGGLVIDGAAPRDFVLRRGVSVAGLVVGPDGPVASAHVAVAWSSGDFVIQVLTTSGDDGGFEFLHVAPGPVVLRAAAEPRFRQADLPMSWVGDLMNKRTPTGAVIVPATGLDNARVTMVAYERPAAGGTAATPKEDAKLVVRGRVTAPGGSVPPETSVEITGPQPGAPRQVADYTFARVPVAADGTFEAQISRSWAPKWFRVRARSPGFGTGVSAPATVTAANEMSVDAALTEPASIAGRVISSAAGSPPVPGARVSLLPQDPGSWGNNEPSPVAAVTDAEGRFRVDAVTPGTYRLAVDAERFARTVMPVTAPLAAEMTIVADPGLDIAGIVRLADGTPVPKVFVSMSREDAPTGGENWWSVQNGGDGRFRVTGLRTGTYKLQTSAVFGTATSVRPFEVGGIAAGRTDVVLVLEAAHRITGRVLDDARKPIGRAKLMARSETGDRHTPSAQTAADGTFTITGLGGGTYIVDAKPPEPRSYGQVTTGRTLLGVRVTGVAPDGAPIDVVLERGLEIRGTYTAADDTTPPGAWVRADLISGPERDPWLDDGRGQSGAETGPGGTFVITGLRPGTYRLCQVLDPGGAGTVLALHGGESAAAGATDVRLRAGIVAPIGGVVVDEDDRPVAGATVDVNPVGGGPRTQAPAVTSADGSFSVDATSDAARYVVSVQKRDLVPARVDDVASGTRNLRIRLLRGLTASGRVLRADGTALASQWVKLSLVGGERSGSVQTDAEGRFVAKGLTEGTWRVEVWVSTPGGSGSKSVACGEVRAGQTDFGSADDGVAADPGPTPRPHSA